ncbi:MAG: CHAT domain-containing protein, partial [Chloroflexota bacterium]
VDRLDTCNHHTFSYAPSASLYILCKERARAQKFRWEDGVVLMGYSGRRQNLRYVREELHEIQKLYPDAMLFVEQEATYETLKEISSRARILHLAAHGEMAPQNPYLSYIELASEEGKESPDAYLRLYDAACLDLRQTDFVCLSACETAQLSDQAGDLLGLQWGFFHAGANTLIANLWQVEERSAARLMTLFYQKYSPEKSKSTALQEAQQALRHEGESYGADAWQRRFVHPYFWGPFATYGFSGPL